MTTSPGLSNTQPHDVRSIARPLRPRDPSAIEQAFGYVLQGVQPESDGGDRVMRSLMAEVRPPRAEAAPADEPPRGHVHRAARGTEARVTGEGGLPSTNGSASGSTSHAPPAGEQSTRGTERERLVDPRAEDRRATPGSVEAQTQPAAAKAPATATGTGPASAPAPVSPQPASAAPLASAGSSPAVVALTPTAAMTRLASVSPGGRPSAVTAPSAAFGPGAAGSRSASAARGTPVAQAPPPRGSDNAEAALRAQATRGLALALKSQSGSATIRLDPQHLGTLRVDVAVREGIVEAIFRPTNTQAQQLLTQDQRALEHALAARGLRVERIEIAPAEEGPSARDRASPDSGSAMEGRTGSGQGEGPIGDRQAGGGDAGRGTPRGLSAERESPGASAAETAEHDDAPAEPGERTSIIDTIA